MKKSKIFTLVLCTALLSVATVLGTLAYLTSRASVTNTFTVGNVEIILDEHLVDENGEKIPTEDCPTTGCRTPEGEQYHILPGQEYDKDPMVTVKADSEESYVRMILTVHNKSAVQAIVDNPIHNLNGDYAGLFTGWDENEWKYVSWSENTDENTISFEFRYKEPVSTRNEGSKELKPLFTKLVVPGTLTNAELQALYGADETVGTDDDFKIVVEAHAIQALGFEGDVDAAWTAFDAQYAATTQTTGE